MFSEHSVKGPHELSFKGGWEGRKVFFCFSSGGLRTPTKVSSEHPDAS